MLQKREKRIVKILFENNNKLLTSNELAVLLSVSSRTIKNDIKNINKAFEKRNFSIETKAGKGMWLEYSKNDISELKEVFSVNDDIDLAEIQFRQIEIAEYLLKSHGYISIEHIAEKIYVSNTTINRELISVETFLKQYNIKIIKEPRKGISLKGEEQNRRIARAELMKRRFSLEKVNEAIKDVKKHFPNIEVKSIQKILKELQKELNITFSELTYSGLLIHTAITIQRLEEGQKITMSEKELARLKMHKEWNMADFYTKALGKVFNIEFNESETGYITIHLMGANLSTNHLVGGELTLIEEIDSRLYNRMKKWIEDISKQYEFDFLSDQLFLSTLFIHLKPLMNRVKYGITISNPYVQELKVKYSLSYEVAVTLARIIEKDYKLVINDDEIGYIAMHIGAAIERLKENKDEKMKAVIICASGIGTSHFLKARINKEFPQIEVIDLISSLDRRLETIECDLIFSTVPIENCSRKVLEVSPLLNRSDKKKIQTELLSHEKEENILLDFLDEKISIFGCSESSVENTIRIGSKCLLKENYVNQDFMQSVIEREQLSPTAVGSLIAIPHAYKGHVIKQGICFIQLNKPIQWGEEKVQLVFLLSLDVSSQEKFMRLFEELLNLSESVKKVDLLIKAKNFREFSAIIRGRE